MLNADELRGRVKANLHSGLQPTVEMGSVTKVGNKLGRVGRGGSVQLQKQREVATTVIQDSYGSPTCGEFRGVGDIRLTCCN